jgi:hypothetical protein
LHVSLSLYVKLPCAEIGTANIQNSLCLTSIGTTLNLKEVKMSQHNFSYMVRQATQVAQAVAEEVVNNTTAYDRKFGHRREQEVRPVLLSYSTPHSKKEVVFRYEGGLVVRVYLFDFDKLTESWRTPHLEDWVVYQVDIRYYQKDPTSYSKTSEKVLEIWDGEKLSRLKELRWWHRPIVAQKEAIRSEVGIFVDSVSGVGFVEADFEYTTIGRSNFWEAVQYSVLIDGDRERAIEEANYRLREILDELN